MILLDLILKFYQILQKALLAFILKPLAWTSTNEKLKQFVSYKSESQFLEKINLAETKLKQFSSKKVFWLHISSAGELEQFKPVAQRLFEQHGVTFFVTYFSPSAVQFLENFPGILGSAGFPLDDVELFKMVFSKLRIKSVIFVRYDLWPALIIAAHRSRVKIFLTAGTENSARSKFVSLRSLLLRYFSHIFVVEKQDISFFNNLKCDATLTGDPKWERVKERVLQSHTKISSNPFLKKIENFTKQTHNHKNILLVAGSPHKEEFECIFSALQKNQHLSALIVPHDISLEKIKSLEKKVNENHISYSLITDVDDSQNKKRVMIVNTVGILAELYSFADIALVGGGFDGQVHNVLEASAHLKVTLVGSKLDRAPEAQFLKQQGACFTFESPAAMEDFLCKITLDEMNSKKHQDLILKTKDIFENILPTSKIISEKMIDIVEREHHA